MKTIDAESLSRMLEEGRVRLLDVLPAASFRRVHIPGSESRPLAELKERARDLLEPGRRSWSAAPVRTVASAPRPPDSSTRRVTGGSTISRADSWSGSARHGTWIRDGRRTTPMTATDGG